MGRMVRFVGRRCIRCTTQVHGVQVQAQALPWRQGQEPQSIMSQS